MPIFAPSVYVHKNYIKLQKSPSLSVNEAEPLIDNEPLRLVIERIKEQCASVDDPLPHIRKCTIKSLSQPKMSGADVLVGDKPITLRRAPKEKNVLLDSNGQAIGAYQVLKTKYMGKCLLSSKSGSERHIVHSRDTL